MAETLVRDEIVSTFGTAANSKVHVKISDPADTATGEVVSNALETVVSKNVLQDANGNLVTDVLGAKRVRVTEEVLF